MTTHASITTSSATVDTDTLRALCAAQTAAQAPVLSLYFALDPRPTAESDTALRQQALTGHLAAEGGAAAAAAHLAPLVKKATPGTGVLAAFATADSVLFATRLPGSAQGDLARYAAVPHLLPLLEWHQQHPAHVLALVDRTGADIEAYPPGCTEPARRRVDGPDDEIERNAPGGRSQMRYQHRAEDSWEHNATQAAGAVTAALTRTGAHVLLLAGDVRAVQYLLKHLPTRVHRDVAVRRVSGGRSPDGAAGIRSVQIVAELHRAAEAETAAVLRHLAAERRPGGRTVDGARATLTALAQGRLDTLVVTDHPRDHRTAWVGPAPTDVAPRHRTLLRKGVGASQAHLTDIAVRAALLTGSDVRVLTPRTPGAPAQGIGGLCRFNRPGHQGP
ncbi:Vms1/Ankzf1 family peptidyl-tRNA hydrolase [Actinomycetota bacterium Odt1-20B]